MAQQPTIGVRDSLTLDAVAVTIGEGHVLHVRADRLPGQRHPRRDAMPATDFTVGPDARGGFLIVDYSTVKSGREEHYETAEEATREARKLVGWDRMPALRFALGAVHGVPKSTDIARADEDARIVARGAALSKSFGHRRPLVAPLFGGCGVPS